MTPYHGTGFILSSIDRSRPRTGDLVDNRTDSLSIGELAGTANVNVETIRFYERRGLLPEPPRRPSGYRAYPPDAVTRVRFIKRAQVLGFTLAEIDELLELRVDEETTCDQVRQQVEDKLAEVEAKLRMLQEMQHALTAMAASCDHGGPDGECPVLAILLEQESQTGRPMAIINQ